MFVKDKYKKDGYKSLCKSCNSAKMKEYHAKDPEKSRAKLYAWREENRQYWLDYLQYRKGKKPDFIPKSKQKKEKRTREEARQREKDRKAQYDIDNKEKNSAYHKSRRPITNQHARRRRRERMKTDPRFRLMEHFRRRFGTLVKKLGHKRSLEYVEMIGCSLDELTKWVESHFEPGMDWSNQGHFSLNHPTWQLDHHYPCSAFDLSDPEQQRQCFHYTNVYPIWAKENLDKKDFIPDRPKENLYIPAFALPQSNK